MSNTPVSSLIGSPPRQLAASEIDGRSSVPPAPDVPATNGQDGKTKKRKDGIITSFFRKKTQTNDEGCSNPFQGSSGGQCSSPPIDIDTEKSQNEQIGNINPSKSVRLNDFDILSLPHDPGLRKKIADYHPNDRELVRREYIRRGPCQPKDHNFPSTVIGGKPRKFSSELFKKFESWLEYSKDKDAAFCFACYLFKKDNARGGEAFVSDGFKTWSRYDAFTNHVGNHMSVHNNAMRELDNFKRQKRSIVSNFENHSSVTKSAYSTRLQASIKTVRFLLLQGLSFRGHDESKTSLNRGNFIELLKFAAEHDEKIAKVVLDNAPGNCMLTSPKIQKEIINACANLTTKKIVEELDGDCFGILVDESADIADKEQMALCLRFVDKKGEYSLTFSKVRGQGYDGASNMQGSINGLKTLILNESPSAYHVHCFAQQLQLILVAVAKKNHDCSWLFETLANLLNLVGSSPKRKEILREKQAEQILKELDEGELESGSGLNQELGLSRPGDTRWHSHFKTILNVLTLYSPILDVIDTIAEFSTGADNVKAESISFALRRFDFVFVAHLMVNIFGVTNELNLALQKKEQDIVNAMSLVNVTKGSLQRMRDDGCDSHMKKVSIFCSKHEIDIPSMDDLYVIPGRHRRGRREVTNLHHFRVEVFLGLIDQILQEFENRFDEVSRELLECMSCFNPRHRFASFDTKKLLRLAEFYPREFSKKDLLFFECQLDTFKYDVQNDDRFWNLNTLQELSMKLVETMKHLTHSKVYLLLKLVLVLPVATATVERAFFAMSFVKNRLRNSMGDEWLNDSLVTFLERDVFLRITEDEIVMEFLNMKTRRIV